MNTYWYKSVAKITRLQAELEQVKREKDAAVKDMKRIADSINDCRLVVAETGDYVRDFELGRCSVCERGDDCDLSIDCDFKWRGLSEGEADGK